MVVVLFIFGVIAMNIGSFIIAMGFKKLRQTATIDLTNSIMTSLPQRVMGLFYWQLDSQKLFLYVMNSKRWPPDQAIRSQLASIRILCLIGAVFITGGFLVGAYAVLSGFSNL